MGDVPTLLRSPPEVLYHHISFLVVQSVPSATGAVSAWLGLA